MKKVLLLSVLFSLQIVLKAQKVYFIYLQSESSAPFYVKMAGKIQSSTPEGYLILPKLTDSTYLVTIGQPGKPDEPKFAVTINKKDRGFLIKNIEGTTGLFDLQSMVVYKPITAETVATETIARNDNFTRLLAKAANDTTLLTESVTPQEKPKAKEPKAEATVAKETVVQKKDTVQQSAIVNTTPADNAISSSKNNTVGNAQSQIINEPAKEQVAENKEPVADIKQETVESSEQEYKKSVITKKAESSTSEGFGLVFYDAYNGIVDTVQLVIPNPKMMIPDTTQRQPVEEKQFLDISSEQDPAKKDSGAEKPIESSVAVKVKPRCASLSTDDDFFKLRRDMVAKKNDDEMIAQAKKYFKGKCFRTEQIKYLSALFLSDEGKYHFFDAAYMYVSDQEKFFSLQTELKDTYYLNRFKALIGN